MNNLKENLKKQDGFIAIVAFGIFALIALFSVMIQQTMIDTVDSVKRSGNNITAQTYSDYEMEYLQLVLRDLEAGYNTEEIICNYGSFAEEEGTGEGDPEFCQPFDKLFSYSENVENVQVKVEIKGRADEDESFGGCTELGFSGDCYVVPFPGTGTAGGDRCRIYSSIFAGDDPDSANTLIGHNGRVLEEGGIEGEDGLKQIDYACNWNKLEFGSSLIDRVAIPFYYENEAGEIISPFHEDPTLNGGDQAQNFIVRVRTPCLPCVYDDQPAELDITRECERSDDPTICYDYDQSQSERYELKVSGIEDDDVVVQWQLTGMCEEGGEDEACGLIQWVKYVNDKLDPGFSGITEGRINYYNYYTADELSHTEDAKHKLLYATLKGIDTTGYEQAYIFKKPPFLPGDLKLPFIKQPLLTLFLSGKLISEAGRNVPYLEYQILTDRPIGNSNTKIRVFVNVNGNGIEEILYKENSTSLIDFAVQN